MTIRDKVRSMLAAQEKTAKLREELQKAELELGETTRSESVRNTLASIKHLERDVVQGVWRIVFGNAAGDPVRIQVLDDVIAELSGQFVSELTK